MNAETGTTGEGSGESFLGKLLRILVHLPAGLLNIIKSLAGRAENEIDNLPPADKSGLIDGVKLAQIIKTNLDATEDEILSFASENLKSTEDVIKGGILDIANKAGGDEILTVKNALDFFKAKVTGITDEQHDSFWYSIGAFAVSWFTQGKLNWISLTLGLLEAAYQKYAKQ